MLETIVIVFATLAGVVTQTVIGFGIAFFLVPALLVYFSPPVTVTVMLLVGSALCLMVLWNERRINELSWPIVRRLFIAAIPGILLGAYIVTHINKAWLQIIIGILIVASVIVQAYVFPKPTKPLKISRGITISGFAAGLLNASAAQAAPPMLLWLRSHITTPNQIRHNLAAAMLLMNILSIITIHFLKPASLGTEGLLIFVYLLPIILVGNILGKLLLRRINTKQFHQIIFIAIIVAGVFSVIVGLRNLR